MRPVRLDSRCSCDYCLAARLAYARLIVPGFKHCDLCERLAPEDTLRLGYCVACWPLWVALEHTYDASPQGPEQEERSA